MKMAKNQSIISFAAATMAPANQNLGSKIKIEFVKKIYFYLLTDSPLKLFFVFETLFGRR